MKEMITFEVSEDLVMSCMSHETLGPAQPRGVRAVFSRVSVAGPNHDIIKIVAPYGPQAQQFRVAVAWMDGLMEASFASLHQRRLCFKQGASFMAEARASAGKLRQLCIARSVPPRPLRIHMLL